MSKTGYKIRKSLVLTPQSAPTDPENGEIYYDSGSNTFKMYSSGSWSNIGSGSGNSTATFIAGQNLNLGEAIYISSPSDTGRTTGRAYLLDATNDNRIEFVGFATAAATAGNNVTVMLSGVITTTGSYTIGMPVYASVSTPGGVQTTAPTAIGQWLIQLGIASSSNQIVINGAGSATAIKIASPYINDMSIVNLGISVTCSSNAMTISVTDSAGNTPSASSEVVVGFQNNNGCTAVSLASNLSLTVPASGTLGGASGLTHDYYVYAINNSGTMKLGIGMVGHISQKQVTTVAISSSSNSNSTIYSDAVYTSKNIRLIGKLTVAQTIAGNWVNVPTVTLTPIKVPPLKILYSSAMAATMNSGSFNRLNFETRSIDTHNAVVTGGLWAFTAPFDGEFTISSFVGMPAYSMWSVGKFMELSLNIGGTGRRLGYFSAQNSSGSPIATVNGSITYKLITGEVLYLQLFHNGGSPAALNADGNYVWITIEGNQLS